MYLKRWSMTLAVAVLLAVLVAPTTKACACSGYVAKAGSLTAADDSAHEDENSGDSAEDTDEGDNPGDVANDSGENSDEPGHHDDSGDGGSGGNGPCTSVSSVSVCADQPRN
jgi:hypothetical protein